MARIEPLHLKVTTDSSDAVDLVPRIETAALDTLTTAGVAEPGTLAAAVAAEVMSVIVRVRQATHEESAQFRAIERVRTLHRQEYGACAECTREYSEAWPCATVRALDGEDPQS